jgi:hypothetical protein
MRSASTGPRPATSGWTRSLQPGKSRSSQCVCSPAQQHLLSTLTCFDPVNRVSTFHELIQENDGKPLPLDDVKSHIATFVHQFDEEAARLKKERRPGRPPSTKEDLLKMKMEGLAKEWEVGFCA